MIIVAVVTALIATIVWIMTPKGPQQTYAHVPTKTVFKISQRTYLRSLIRSSTLLTLTCCYLMWAITSRPPYRPTSVGDFLSRLSTFKLATYRDKPRGTDAVAAARCGWKNDGQDRLVCDSCLAAWVVGLTAGMNRDAGELFALLHALVMY